MKFYFYQNYEIKNASVNLEAFFYFKLEAV